MKRLFLFIILVGRNWALGSCESNKTGRAILGLSLSISMYLVGFLLNLMGLTDRPLKDAFNMSVESLALIYLIILAVLYIAPIYYLKKFFPDDMLAEKIAAPDYQEKYNRPINHILSLAFVIGSFIVLFFLPNWLS